MKRLCIFAHYDRDNIIDDYVIYYLKALREVCSLIFFVSDCNLDEIQLSKLNGIADEILAKHHGEYDFGSYKRGFFHALEKKTDFDELLFVNDSCYGPFFSLAPIFEKMGKKKCDFWGMTQNRYGIKKVQDKPNVHCIAPHIQSYFLVLKPQVFNSAVFREFLQNVQQEEDKDDIIIKYEVGLSTLLYQNNFTSRAYIEKFKYFHNYMGGKWDKLITRYNFPFLKTTIIKNGFSLTGKVEGWEKILSRYTNYPIELIEQNSQRLLNLYESKYEQMNIYRKIRYNILKCLPDEIRFIVIFIEKYTFKIINTMCFNKLKKF